MANLHQRFHGVVCRSGRSVAAKEKHNLPPQLPWLMFLQCNYNPGSFDLADIKNHPNRYFPTVKRRNASHFRGKPCRYILGFFNLANRKIPQLLLPEGHDKKCFSSQGWLLTVGLDLDINLFNPFTRFQISLPSHFQRANSMINTLRNHPIDPRGIQHFYVQKMTLSANPSTSSPKDCIVMVIHGVTNILAFCRPGDEKRIIINSPSIVYYNDRFYAADVQGRVFACELGDANAIQVKSPLDGLRSKDKKYLVGSSEDMMLVVRNLEFCPILNNRPYNPYWTVGFTVFRLNRDGDRNGWVKVKNLGNRLVFVGDNSSVCLPVGDCDDHGLKRNCIYFTNDICEGYDGVQGPSGYDMGVYNLEDETIETYYFADVCIPGFPSLWFMSSLQK